MREKVSRKILTSPNLSLIKERNNQVLPFGIFLRIDKYADQSGQHADQSGRNSAQVSAKSARSA